MKPTRYGQSSPRREIYNPQENRGKQMRLQFKKKLNKKGRLNTEVVGNSLMVWLGLQAFIAKDLGWIPGWGTKIPQATWHGQKIKKVRK